MAVQTVWWFCLESDANDDIQIQKQRQKQKQKQTPSLFVIYRDSSKERWFYGDRLHLFHVSTTSPFVAVRIIEALKQKTPAGFSPRSGVLLVVDVMVIVPVSSARWLDSTVRITIRVSICQWILARLKQRIH